MKKSLLLLLMFQGALVQGQDLTFAKKMVDTLTSPYFWGRGYTGDGMKRAADFLSAAYEEYGLVPMKGKSFQQSFTYPVNTFPGRVKLSVNGKELVPGEDYLIGPESRGVKTNGKVGQMDSTHFVDRENAVVFKLENKLTWSVAPKEEGYTMVLLDKKSISGMPSSYEIDVENKVISKFKAANICGMVKGTREPDSMILISAHYDHLGGMGADTYFPGANDNASGVALLLNLARYYAKNPAPYSIGFICFAGEEAGLIGSKYFTENPLIPLKKIRFMMNTDLAGTGVDGITVVNASEFPKEFELMNKINDEHKYLSKINARGKAANSDHYFFTELGVPAFFFYTLGGIAAYHDVFDKAATLPLNEHEDLFQLVVKFNDGLMKK